MSKNKKILILTGIGVDVVITIFLFIISIIMIATMPRNQAEASVRTGLIGYLQNHPTVYLCAFVIPLFVLLAANIVLLFLYVKKSAPKKEKVELNELSDEQKEALKKELLKDIENK